MNLETKRVVLLVIALLSTPVFLGGGVIFSYFWYAVIRNSAHYSESIFEVNEISPVRYGSKTRYEVAVGRVGGAEEILYGWHDYFRTGDQTMQANGRRVEVMYNPKASRVNYSGRNLRVLSLAEFKTAHRRLFQWLGFGAVSPILWVVYLRFGRGAQNKGATKWAAHENA